MERELTATDSGDEIGVASENDLEVLGEWELVRRLFSIFSCPELDLAFGLTAVHGKYDNTLSVSEILDEFRDILAFLKSRGMHSGLYVSAMLYSLDGMIEDVYGNLREEYWVPMDEKVVPLIKGLLIAYKE